MEKIKIDIRKALGVISQSDVTHFANDASKHLNALYSKTGKGNDFLGWVKLPSEIGESQLQDIEKTAKDFAAGIDVCVVIGIGGSYLGAKAVNDAIADNFAWLKGGSHPHMIFAGHNICEDYLHELIQLLDKKSYGIIVISKSGTTTEPAVAFRILQQHLIKKVGAEKAKSKIIAVTDGAKGALKQLATDEGYKSYVIPDDVGGRYSVLTPVGLLPLAVCGVNVRELVKGSQDMQKATGPDVPADQNIAAIYAATRNALYNKGKKVEIFVNYNNKLHFTAEWWKQLYGESEGKENKGIFPASVDFSSDLHSMGQYIQEGERMLFETVVSVKETNQTVLVPKDAKDLDKLNFLSGRRIQEVNKMAELGTILAHIDGGVPNIHIELPKLNEYYMGQLLYFFEIACGVSGYMLNVNPFDQPGVEAYKKNMFALLGKPGFEEETKKLNARL